MLELLWCIVGGLTVGLIILLVYVWGMAQVIAELARRVKELEQE